MVSKLAIAIKNRLYGNDTHPYHHFEAEVAVVLRRHPGTLLDIGCGREAPVVRAFKGQADRLIGLDVVDFRVSDPDITLLHGSMSAIPMPDESVDVIMARSVMEHITDPEAGFQEIRRVLRKGGAFVFLIGGASDPKSLPSMARFR